MPEEKDALIGRRRRRFNEIVHERSAVCAFAQCARFARIAMLIIIARRKCPVTIVATYFSRRLLLKRDLFFSLFCLSLSCETKNFHTFIYGWIFSTNSDFLSEKKKNRKCQRVNNVHVYVDQIAPPLPSRGVCPIRIEEFLSSR